MLEILEYRVLATVRGPQPGRGVVDAEDSVHRTESGDHRTGDEPPHRRARLITSCHPPGGPIAHFTPPADGYVSGQDWQAVAPLPGFNDRAGSIHAGNEIQRNILAKATWDCRERPWISI